MCFLQPTGNAAGLCTYICTITAVCASVVVSTVQNNKPTCSEVWLLLQFGCQCSKNRNTKLSSHDEFQKANLANSLYMYLLFSKAVSISFIEHWSD